MLEEAGEEGESQERFKFMSWCWWWYLVFGGEAELVVEVLLR